MELNKFIVKFGLISVINFVKYKYSTKNVDIFSFVFVDNIIRQK